MEFRDLTSEERRTLARLLQDRFPGREELLEQLNHCQVCAIDENESLKFAVDRGNKAQVLERIPVEAQYVERDGVKVNVLLHVLDGQLDERELFRDDSGHLLDPPNVRNFDVWIK